MHCRDGHMLGSETKHLEAWCVFAEADKTRRNVLGQVILVVSPWGTETWVTVAMQCTCSDSIIIIWSNQTIPSLLWIILSICSDVQNQITRTYTSSQGGLKRSGWQSSAAMLQSMGSGTHHGRKNYSGQNRERNIRTISVNSCDFHTRVQLKSTENRKSLFSTSPCNLLDQQMRKWAFKVTCTLNPLYLTFSCGKMPFTENVIQWSCTRFQHCGIEKKEGTQDER